MYRFGFDVNKKLIFVKFSKQNYARNTIMTEIKNSLNLNIIVPDIGTKFVSLLSALHSIPPQEFSKQ